MPRLRPALRLAALLSVLACLPAACSRPAGHDDGPGEPDADGYPKRLETPSGLPLVLTRAPRAVLPANASALDYVAALLPAERIAAIPEPALPWTNAPVERGDWAAVPRVPRYEGETVLTVGPDLVVAHESQSADTARVLRDAGIAVAELPTFRDFDSVRASIAFLGDALEVPGRAAELLDELDARIAALADDPVRADLSAAGYTNYGTGGWIAGARTSADAVIRLAGMRNAAAEAGYAAHPRIDFEGLLELDPDVLVVGGSEFEGEASPTYEYLKGEPALSSLRALREGRVIVLPAALFGTDSHRLVEAAEQLAREVDALVTAGSDR